MGPYVLDCTLDELLLGRGLGWGLGLIRSSVRGFDFSSFAFGMMLLEGLDSSFFDMMMERQPFYFGALSSSSTFYFE